MASPARRAACPRTRSSPGPTSTIGIGSGALVAGVGDRLVRSKLLGDDTLSPVPVVATSGEPTKVGATDHRAPWHRGWLAWRTRPLPRRLRGRCRLAVHELPRVEEGPRDRRHGQRRAESICSSPTRALGSATVRPSPRAGRRADRAMVHRRPPRLDGRRRARRDRRRRGYATPSSPTFRASTAATTGRSGSPPGGLVLSGAERSASQRTFAAAGDLPRAVRAVSAGVDRVVARGPRRDRRGRRSGRRARQRARHGDSGCVDANETLDRPRRRSSSASRSASRARSRPTWRRS